MPVSLAGGRLLITPLGLSSGVLFSAIGHRPAARAIVVTSAAARAGIKPSLAAAGLPDLACDVMELSDPHCGFVEARAIAERGDLRAALAEAAEVVVNLTGGTTAMAHVVQRFTEEAAVLGAPVQRCALVDQPSADEQRSQPYVLGEIIDL